MAEKCAGGRTCDGVVIRRVHSSESGGGGAAERTGSEDGAAERTGSEDSKLGGGATMAKPPLVYPSISRA